MNPLQETKFLTPRELSERWRCSLMKLRRMRRAGILPVFYLGRSARYALSDVERIEREARYQPQSETAATNH